MNLRLSLCLSAGRELVSSFAHTSFPHPKIAYLHASVLLITICFLKGLDRLSTKKNSSICTWISGLRTLPEKSWIYIWISGLGLLDLNPGSAPGSNLCTEGTPPVIKRRFLPPGWSSRSDSNTARTHAPHDCGLRTQWPVGPPRSWAIHPSCDVKLVSSLPAPHLASGSEPPHSFSSPNEFSSCERKRHLDILWLFFCNDKWFFGVTRCREDCTFKERLL